MSYDPNRDAQQRPPPAPNYMGRAVLIGIGAALLVLAVGAGGIAFGSSRNKQSPVVITATPLPSIAPTTQPVAAAATSPPAPAATPSAVPPTSTPQPPTVQPTAPPTIPPTVAPTATPAPLNLAGKVADDIPGTPLQFGVTVTSIVAGTKNNDVYSVQLKAGQTLRIRSMGDMSIRIYEPAFKSIDSSRIPPPPLCGDKCNATFFWSQQTGRTTSVLASMMVAPSNTSLRRPSSNAMLSGRSVEQTETLLLSVRRWGSQRRIAGWKQQ